MTEEEFAKKLQDAGLSPIPPADLAAALPSASRLAQQAKLVRQALAEGDD